jgi:DNA-binding NtrC family response regulator
MDKKIRIIVIDDDQTIREVLRDFLQELGYQVILASDGLEGMEKIKQERYDLIVLDIRMPYVSGIGLIKIAREINPHIPVICMTGYGVSPEKIAAEEEVNLILSKPFELKTLSQAISKLLS